MIEGLLSIKNLQNNGCLFFTAGHLGCFISREPISGSRQSVHYCRSAHRFSTFPVLSFGTIATIVKHRAASALTRNCWKSHAAVQCWNKLWYCQRVAAMVGPVCFNPYRGGCASHCGITYINKHKHEKPYRPYQLKFYTCLIYCSNWRWRKLGKKLFSPMACSTFYTKAYCLFEWSCSCGSILIQGLNTGCQPKTFKGRKQAGE